MRYSLLIAFALAAQYRRLRIEKEEAQAMTESGISPRSTLYMSFEYFLTSRNPMVNNATATP